MQKETNTKIAIRGKGSVKDGASRDPKYDYGEEEELHVLISGDTQQDVSCWLFSSSACCACCGGLGSVIVRAPVGALRQNVSCWFAVWRASAFWRLLDSCTLCSQG